ncbi:hypothetical protein CC78DRAFT_615686 [Lojkania enalia]|uniref:Mitochondrial division protein 1 n=1 Tax=Lojkania enalia TaxID=147567 RepID=A0A9P4N769_9PLEO|nr:hypothetical protein CC78DRAFT_615686 [Didymosphaeria enalia]
MRLLRLSDNGEPSLTEDLADNEAIPPYAILSLAWGVDEEEVTFEDLTNGVGKDKPGYGKIHFYRAYSLLGIFNIYIPPIYGEGTASAFKQLMDKINRLENCIQDVRTTDPCDDKKRIEEAKGGLLEGDPGKGKTMLLCGIVNDLKKSLAKADLLSYFFCQATDVRINSTIAVLRGLLYLLVDQQPSLVSHIRRKHDYAGNTLFENTNAWIAVREIFANIIHDLSLSSTYLIIDALDKCVIDLPKLLDFIIEQSSASPRVKWIVLSRNWPDIKERLAKVGRMVRLSLELNVESVSAAVSVFIQQKGACLQTLEGHSSPVRSVAFSHDLTRLASGSFDSTVKIWDVGSGACLQTLEGHSSSVASVAFSHDSIRLASGSHDSTVKIWETSSGACLQTLDVSRPLYNISFNATGSCLCTEIGVILIGSPAKSNSTTTVTDPQHPQHQYAALSPDNVWITYNSKNLVWLLSDYRPSRSTVSGKMIGIGVGSGKVWI